MLKELGNVSHSNMKLWHQINYIYTFIPHFTSPNPMRACKFKRKNYDTKGKTLMKCKN